MTSRTVALRVEELNARDLPSAVTPGPVLGEHLRAVIAHHHANSGQTATPMADTTLAHLPALIVHHADPGQGVSPGDVTGAHLPPAILHRITGGGTASPAAVGQDPTVLKAVIANKVLGQATGNYTVAAPTPDAGTGYNLSGTGTFAGLGSVTVAGTVQGVGLIQQGNAGGTLTLTNSQGSVTLQLTGPSQGGFSTLPPVFKYHIVSGTGAFSDAQGSGVLKLTLLAGDVSGQGSFRLVG
jgi:hypothetical protein